ncbi:5-hydroxytryptamine receptor 1F-like [Ambystoma mexicanum]|uniref:5-hydroxytryptamine receptor 1F-like n=1 Tax=Ambystoma mexicanum TaxID=8296 RepID=UPI0037E769E8
MMEALSSSQRFQRPTLADYSGSCQTDISQVIMGQPVLWEGLEAKQQANQSTSSSEENSYPGMHRLILEILLITMCGGALTGNMLVVFIIAANKRFHSLTSAFIINLAISDFLVGLGIMPFVAMSVLYDDWANLKELCLFVGYTSSVYSSASTLSVAAIALDRYWTIVDCLQHDSPRSNQRTWATITWIWLQALLSSLPPLVGWGRITYVPDKHTCHTDWTGSSGHTVFFAVFSVFLPISIMIFCYLKIVSIARAHVERIHNLENQLRRNSTRTNASEVEKPTCSRLIYFVNCKLLAEVYSCDTQSIASYFRDMQCTPNANEDLSQNDCQARDSHGRFRLLLVILVFTCCWIPYVIVSLTQSIEKTYTKKTSSIPPSVVTIAYWLSLLSSDINPFLYALLNKRFQKALRSICHDVQTSGGMCPTHEHPPFPRRRTSSNVTGISSLFCPSDSPTPDESNVADHSSVSSDLSEHTDGPVAGEGFDSPSCLPKAISAEAVQDGVLLKPTDLAEQFLQVPYASPCRKQHSLSLPAQPLSKKSTLVCGKITIKVDYHGD